MECISSPSNPHKTSHQEFFTQEEILLSQLNNLHLQPPCPSIAPLNELQLRMQKISRQLLSQPDVLKVLQDISQGISSTELTILIRDQAKVLIPHLIHPAASEPTACIRNITSHPNSRKERTKFLGISIPRSLASGFYVISRESSRKGTQKKIIHLCSYPSVDGIQQNLALATYRKKYMHLYKQQNHVLPSFTHEYKMVKFLHDNNVPYIVDMNVLPYHEKLIEPTCLARFNPAQCPVKFRTKQTIVMEYCHETLHEFLARPSSLETRVQLCRQLTLSLSKMHALHIVHNDLKLNNIGLIVKNQLLEIRLLDFGSSQRAFSTSPIETDICATYPPFEMMENNKNKKLTPTTQATDLWGLGNLIIALATKENVLDAWGLRFSNSSYETNYTSFRAYIDSLNPKNLHPIDLCALRLFSHDPKTRVLALDIFVSLSSWLEEENKKSSSAFGTFSSALLPHAHTNATLNLQK